MHLARAIRSGVILGYMYAIPYILTEPEQVISRFAPPVLIFAYLAAFAPTSYRALATVGVLLAIPTNEAITRAGAGVVWDKFMKFKDVLVVSPIGPGAYVIGMVVGAVLVSGLPIITFLIVLGTQLTTSPFQILATILLVLFSTAMASLIGFTVATYFDVPQRATNVTGLLSIVLIYGAPVFYPLSAVPRWIALIFQLLPTTPIAEILRSVLGIEFLTSQSLIVDVGEILAYTLGLTYIAMKRSRWRES